MSLPEVPQPGAPTEPLTPVAAIVAVVTAALGLVVAFGFKLSPDQTATIIGVFSVAAPVIVAIWGRRKVFSPATVRALVTQAEKKI